MLEQQQAILDSALELLASGGPQALRVRDIADAAGCTTMTVYSRFGGKDGIIEAIYLDGFRRFTVALEDEIGGIAATRLERLGMTYRSWALANLGSYQVMFTEAVPGFQPSPEASLISMGAFQVLIDAVKTLQTDGLIRAGDSTEIAWALWGLTHGLVMLELIEMNPTQEPVSSERIYVNALHDMVKGLAG